MYINCTFWNFTQNIYKLHGYDALNSTHHEAVLIKLFCVISDQNVTITIFRSSSDKSIADCGSLVSWEILLKKNASLWTILWMEQEILPSKEELIYQSRYSYRKSNDHAYSSIKKLLRLVVRRLRPTDVMLHRHSWRQCSQYCTAVNCVTSFYYSSSAKWKQLTFNDDGKVGYVEDWILQWLLTVYEVPNSSTSFICAFAETLLFEKYNMIHSN